MTSELGNLREDVGVLKGTVFGIKHTVDRLEEKMDEHERIAAASRERIVAAITQLQHQMQAKEDANKKKSSLLGHVWTACYTLVAAVIAAAATYFSTGHAGPHP